MGGGVRSGKLSIGRISQGVIGLVLLNHTAYWCITLYTRVDAINEALYEQQENILKVIRMF